jgi:hypothetical protein
MEGRRRAPRRASLDAGRPPALPARSGRVRRPEDAHGPGQRRTEKIATEPLQAVVIVHGDETLAWKCQPSSWACRGPGRSQPTEIRLVAQALDAGAGMGTKSDAALERPHRIDLAWLVR